jgi:hypothetical protein
MGQFYPGCAVNQRLKMRQSTIIFGTILVAFVMYITLRGQLNSYLGLFSGKGGSGVSTSSNVEENTPDKPNTSDPYGLNELMSNMGLQ